MASYFVACRAEPDGAHAVHDRSRCPPGCFPVDAAAEYLGEFDEPAQALAVARLRYAQARGCSCCELMPLPPPTAREPAPLLYPVRH
jgi:hypothetical protein